MTETESMSTPPYPIGAKVWHNGDRITITTEPYTIAGFSGTWQDGETADGHTTTVTAEPRTVEQPSRIVTPQL